MGTAPGGGRDTAIISRVLGGETLQRVADDHSITRQRVSQIMRTRCPGWDGDQRRAERASEARTARADAVAVAVAAGRITAPGRHGGRPRVWGDGMVLDALRAMGGPSGAAPSVNKWRSNGGRPSVTVIITRFGSWNNACLAAGLRVRPPPVPALRIDDETMIGAVISFLTEPDAHDRGGVRAYTAWARSAGAPSPSVLRARFGSWSEVKRLAVIRITPPCDTVSVAVPKTPGPLGGQYGYLKEVAQRL